jgi:hypothetical protein
LPLEYLRSQGNDFGEAFVAEFASDGAENARTSGIAFGINDYGSIIVKTNTHATITAHGMSGANDYCPNYFGFFDTHIGGGIFDYSDNGIANAAIGTIARTEDANAHYFTRAAIVRNG